MKVVILAGGFGTRISEESHLRPKPMVEIGGQPILWHIMRLYAHHGLTDFIICLGYKGYMIKEYFANYVLHRSDVTLDLGKNEITYLNNAADPWRVTLIDTGAHTQTGGRIKRVQPYLDPDESFCLTYGDGVADVNVTELVESHRQNGLAATVTVVRPPGRFGLLELGGHTITRFVEKPLGDGNYINGGFFVLNPSVLDRIPGDDTVWEQEPLQGLARDGQLAAFHHDGFWRCMDTLREKELLEELWQRGDAPWKVWA